MLPVPDGHKQVVHNYFPGYELLITKVPEDDSVIYVYLDSMGDICYSTTIKVPEQEMTVEEFLYAIVLKAQEYILRQAMKQKQRVKEIYGDVHVRH